MLKKLNRCDIYVGLWCLYMLQGVIYSKGIINQSLQLVMLLWGLIISVNFFKFKMPPILKSTLLLLGMYILYGCLNLIFNEGIEKVPNYLYLQNSLNSLIPILLFYYFTKNKWLTSNRIRIYLPFFIIICILLYYKNATTVLEDSNKEEITNNVSYMFTSLIPLLLFYSKKTLLQYSLLIIIVLFIFMGMKRGAILIGVGCIIILFYANYRNSSKWSKLFIVFLFVMAIVAIIYFINYMMNNSAYFALRVEQSLDGNTSGRDFIYSNLWNALISETNIFYFFFGRGANSTINIIGYFAHQDWLETFCNNGLLGVFILFRFFYVFGKSVWLSKKYFPVMMFFSFLILFFASFSKTMFSMSIQNLNICQSLLLGYFTYWLSQAFQKKKISEMD